MAGRAMSSGLEVPCYRLLRRCSGCHFSSCVTRIHSCLIISGVQLHGPQSPIASYRRPGPPSPGVSLSFLPSSCAHVCDVQLPQCFFFKKTSFLRRGHTRAQAKTGLLQDTALVPLMTAAVARNSQDNNLFHNN